MVGRVERDRLKIWQKKEINDFLREMSGEELGIGGRIQQQEHD